MQFIPTDGHLRCSLQLTVKIMPSFLTHTIEQLQHTGGRQPVSLSQLDQYFHPMQFLETLKQATTQSETVVPAVAVANNLVCDGRTFPGASPAAARSVGAQLPPSPTEYREDAWKIFSEVAADGDFEIKLLICEKGDWCAIASYSYKRGRARRCIYYSNGDRQPCFLDLPPQVVLDMAQEDFTRHWLDYYREYLYEPSERSWFPGRE